MPNKYDPNVTFALAPDLIEKVDRVAKAELLTRSAWIRRTVVKAAQQHEPAA
jgi:hypothetical protein